MELDPSDPLYRQFAKIFETFRIDDDEEVMQLQNTFFALRLFKIYQSYKKNLIVNEGYDLEKES